MDGNSLVAAVRHRRKLFLSLLAVSFVILLGLGHPRVRQHASALWDDRIGGPAGGGPGYEVDERPKGGYAKVVGGLDGFYVFENVYVKDRRLYLVQDSGGPPLPEVHKIITSTVADTYDPSDLVSRLEAPLPGAYDTGSPDFDAEIAGRWQDNDNFPDVPRLVVLSAEDAARIIPGWGWEAAEDVWPPDGLFEARELADEVVVLGGTTFYLADDATQIGWGALMHHYFHFVGELILGTYHAFESALLAEEGQSLHEEPHRPPPEIIDDLGARGWLPFVGGAKEIDRRDPARIIIPWTTTWQGKDFDELVARKAFGHAPLIDRTEWTLMNNDHQWRLFSRVVITDRNAAHNDYWSQTSRWNKMALDVLSQPLPAQTPPTNFFVRPQRILASQLGVKAYPDRRPGTEESYSHGKGLVPGEVRIVYVDRQASDRKLDGESNAALLELLEEVQATRSGSPKVVVEHVRFEDMHAAEQIKTAMRADIWLGVHGNGLTHLVWTPSGATVIEMFPLDSFIRDYQLLSTALDHRYYTVWRDRLIGEEDWGTERGGIGAGKLHDGTRIQIDKEFMRGLLSDAVRGMS